MWRQTTVASTSGGAHDIDVHVTSITVCAQAETSVTQRCREGANAPTRAKARYQSTGWERLRPYFASLVAVTPRSGLGGDVVAHSVRYTFDVLSRRYRYALSIVLTSNNEFAEWSTLFPNPTCAETLVDRLMRRAGALTIEARATDPRSR